jgi:transcriptional regulator with XRE-family HTH domain
MKTKNGDLNPDPMKIRKILGKNIRKYRTAAKISQMHLAANSRLDLTTLNRIEAGKSDTTLSSLSRIRVALDVPWKLLLLGV